MKKDIGLYIHIPFCKSKCHYCDFLSFQDKNNLIEKYVKAVIKEIQNEKLSKYNIKTIYIGGGTPSILESKKICEILEELRKDICEEAEITIEVNPGTVSEEKLKSYINYGINRLSIGLQSTDNNLLKQLGRIHNFEEFIQTYKQARQIGFKNINVDLMLGIPNQTLNILENSLKEVILLKPEHISVYSLILEEGTILEKQINTGNLKMIDEELEREMYWKAKKILEDAGYIHYEISNFAKDGYMSRHNVDCWKQKEYLGIGAAAHSYSHSVRYSNITNIEKYIDNIENGDFGNNKIVHEIQTKEDIRKEYMLLGLRKIEGINITEYENKFGENPLFLYKKQINKLIKQNLIEINKDYIKLTERGLDFANIVWEEFV